MSYLDAKGTITDTFSFMHNIDFLKHLYVLCTVLKCK